MCLRAFVIGVCALAAVTADAQPMPDPSPLGAPQTSGGGTKIPVASGDTEILGAETAAASVAPHIQQPSIAIDEPIDPITFICGPGDVLELNFWGQQNFRLRVTVDLEGRTFISKVGFVEVGGKPLATVRADIKKRVRATYPGLQFDLTLATPRSFVVHVAENVKNPGAYTSGPLERVSTVVAKAGGITGSQRRIVLRRKNGKTVAADLLMYELTGDAKHNPYVLDGDVVVVPVRGTTVAIAGAVHRPGRYELTASKDLVELLSVSGGLTSLAARSLPIRVIRHDAQQLESFEDIKFSESVPAVALRDEDSVIVPDVDQVQRSVLLIGAVAGVDMVDMVTASRRLTFIEGDTVGSMLDRAGGIKSAGDLRRAYITRPSDKGSLLIAVDLEALMVRRDRKADVKVAVGDTLVVPALQYGILVEGAVSRPGPYAYNPTFGVLEYIARAGGRTRTAQDIDDVRIVDTQGRTRAFKSSVRPSPGDSILVPERNFTRAEVVQLVIAGAGLILSGVAVTLAATR